MKNTALVILLGFLLGLSLPESVESKTVKVMENIYTIVQGEGIDSNTTFIVTEDGVIVIDTRITPAEANKALQELRKITDKPILYTINTHYHGDHTFGNQVFKESKTIIAHENVRKLLIGVNGQDHLEAVKSFGIEGLEEVKVTPPNMTYKKKMEIYAGAYRLQLLYLGRGHTDGDTVVYLEELKTVIAGDLVFNKKIPYMGDAYIDEWIDSLQWIEDTDNEIIIPGHGNVGGKPIVIAMKHYLINLRNQVQDQMNSGKTLQETKDAVGPFLREKYKDWEKLDWIDANIERAYLEYSLKDKI